MKSVHFRGSNTNGATAALEQHGVAPDTVVFGDSLAPAELAKPAAAM